MVASKILRIRCTVYRIDINVSIFTFRMLGLDARLDHSFFRCQYVKNDADFMTAYLGKGFDASRHDLNTPMPSWIYSGLLAPRRPDPSAHRHDQIYDFRI